MMRSMLATISVGAFLWIGSANALPLVLAPATHSYSAGTFIPAALGLITNYDPLVLNQVTQSATGPDPVLINSGAIGFGFRYDVFTSDSANGKLSVELKAVQALSRVSSALTYGLTVTGDDLPAGQHVGITVTGKYFVASGGIHLPSATVQSLASAEVLVGLDDNVRRFASSVALSQDQYNSGTAVLPLSLHFDIAPNEPHLFSLGASVVACCTPELFAYGRAGISELAFEIDPQYADRFGFIAGQGIELNAPPPPTGSVPTPSTPALLALGIALLRRKRICVLLRKP